MCTRTGVRGMLDMLQRWRGGVSSERRYNIVNNTQQIKDEGGDLIFKVLMSQRQTKQLSL